MPSLPHKSSASFDPYEHGIEQVVADLEFFLSFLFHYAYLLCIFLLHSSLYSLANQSINNKTVLTIQKIAAATISILSERLRRCFLLALLLAFLAIAYTSILQGGSPFGR